MSDITDSEQPDLLEEMRDSAAKAGALLKALSHENRLLILCMLAEGEKAVAELERELGMRQPAVSQQLARLRGDELVKARRDGKTIYYSIASPEAKEVIELLYNFYCAPARS